MVKAPSINKPERESAHIDADASALKTLRGLWPYIWPSDRADLKRRVAIAFFAMLLGKLANVLTPYAFKWATDALSDPGAADGVGVVGMAERSDHAGRSLWAGAGDECGL